MCSVATEGNNAYDFDVMWKKQAIKKYIQLIPIMLKIYLEISG